MDYSVHPADEEDFRCRNSFDEPVGRAKAPKGHINSRSVRRLRLFLAGLGDFGDLFGGEVLGGHPVGGGGGVEVVPLPGEVADGFPLFAGFGNGGGPAEGVLGVGGEGGFGIGGGGTVTGESVGEVGDPGGGFFGICLWPSCWKWRQKRRLGVQDRGCWSPIAMLSRGRCSPKRLLPFGIGRSEDWGCQLSPVRRRLARDSLRPSLKGRWRWPFG